MLLPRGLTNGRYDNLPTLMPNQLRVRSYRITAHYPHSILDQIAFIQLSLKGWLEQDAV